MRMTMWRLLFLVASAASLPTDWPHMAVDYFQHKHVKYVAHLSCKDAAEIKSVLRLLMNEGIRAAVGLIDQGPMNIMPLLYQYEASVGVLVDGDCINTRDILNNASESMMFDDTHFWLVMNDNCSMGFVEDTFLDLKLSVDADVVVASYCGDIYQLTDVFNFGRVQGNALETRELGAWTSERGLEILLQGFKYYNRWDFHNLTLRAVSVIRNSSKEFHEGMLYEPGFTVGVAAMTKISSQLLNLLKEMHNFRFNYTIVGRWIGTPERNSTKAMSNMLLWRDQDISSTCTRLFSNWLDWMDPFFPSVTELETKFYYTISEKGIGDYENQFLTPMSPEVWWCAAATGVVCALVLVAAAAVERRPEPGSYGVFSVLAAGFQQDYEDGHQTKKDSSSRKLALLVVGLTSMLMYNYYTSSVVFWLLNAAAPSLDSLDGLIKSDFELVFEDIGYTRQWLDNPGFFYYMGYKNEKEDELRAKKVTNAKRTLPLFESIEDGIELMRTGKCAFHTEPYTASQVISRTFADKDLCSLAGLQIMPPSYVYVMGQKNSPYRQFFVWSMMRLLERGHTRATRARVGGQIPPCSGLTPRALSLGQAAPAFLLLAEFILLSALILTGEILWHRYTFPRTCKQVLPPKKQEDLVQIKNTYWRSQ
ncbi:ionotropic receptor 75a-like isoform X1 [Cydia pomonella]|uniref:ionotropic receptor 75a-like isoform X1 n=2 Tax=Cydia pomonella TaxID=82600 RepID=UPI002ADD9482|nr:ionotropic receptor 75a-like isoform X1 [Cydia pomonella]